MHWKRDWRLIKLYAVVTRCAVLVCLTAGDGCDEVQRACDRWRRHRRARERLNRRDLRLRRGARIAVVRERSPSS